MHQFPIVTDLTLALPVLFRACLFVCVSLFTQDVFTESVCPGTLKKSDWQQHVSAECHDGKTNLCQFKRAHSSDTSVIFIFYFLVEDKLP